MARYRMDDGTVLDTDNATHTWQEGKRWDGNNNISMATNCQWSHQQLYRSRKGRYYLEHTSQYSGSTPYAEWVSDRTAAAWLLANDRDLPDDLSAVGAEVLE